MTKTTPAPADGDARRIDYRSLADIVPADRNPKAHDARTIDRSLARFGYVELIAEDGRTGKLVAGHGRLERLRQWETDGREPPEGVVVDEDGAWRVPVLVGWSSKDDAEAAAYLLISNRASERGGWQRKPLAEFLADLDSEATDLRELGWSDDEYGQLMTETGVQADREGSFLDDLAAGADAPEDPRKRPARGQGADVVDLRLPMADRERDEAVALLRRHQRALTDAGRPDAGKTLSTTVLEVLRTWSI